MFDLILTALVWAACAATGECPVRPNRPLPRDISPDPVPTKPPEPRCEPTAPPS